MLSQLVSGVGCQFENGLSLPNSLPSCRTITKSERVAQRHLSVANCRASSTHTSRTFTPMRLLFWATLFLGIRGQSTEPFPAAMELSSLNGTNGFVLNGEAPSNLIGTSVSSAGDVNRDGIADFLVGASGSPNGKIRAGKSYVIFGKKGLGSLGRIELSSLRGANGFVLNGEAADDKSGSSVSSAGDVNGDGIDDLVIGAYFADPNGKSNAGKSYVIFGQNGLGSSGSIELSSLGGTTGFVLNGEAADDKSGVSVSSAGDVNGDGITDLLIGAYWASPNGKSKAGKSYVIFGKKGLGSSGRIELSSLGGTTGFVLNGEAADDKSGVSVSSAGDVNGDGIDDLLIGAYEADPFGKVGAGKSYVIFGKAGLGSLGRIELSSLTGRDGFVLKGEASNDKSGLSVSGAGDVNGDGLNDLLISAYWAGPNGKFRAGKSYVIFGKKGLGSSGSIELSSLTGANGFVLNGEEVGDWSGSPVASAGDVNGDGIADILIGAYEADPSGKNGAGKSYVIFGKIGLGASGSIELSSLTGSNGFVLNGEAEQDHSSSSISGSGDVDGDGIDDIIIGATGADPNGKSFAGKCYVIFGRNLTSSASTTTTVSTRTFSQPQTTKPPGPQSTSIFTTKIDKSPPTNTKSVSDSQTATPTAFQSTFSFITEKDEGNTVSTSTTQETQEIIPSNATFVESQEPSSPSSTPLIVGVAGAVAAFACSLFGGILFYLNKRSPSIDKEQGTALSSTQPDPAVPAGYVDIRSLQPEMHSARVEGNYAIISVTKQDDHYTQFPSKPVPKGTGHYHKGGLEELNQKMDEYLSTKDVV